MSDPGPTSDLESATARAAVLRRAAGMRPLWLDVAGDSMGATIASGSKVRVEPATRPRRGQIWAFCTEDGRVLVHRFLGSSGPSLWFQGDANPRPDRPVTAALLIGRVRETNDRGTSRPVGVRATVAGRVRLEYHAVWRRVARLITLSTKVD